MSQNGSDVAADEVAGPVVIGISFGNTNSSISYSTPEGKAEVIADEAGDRQIPTVLSYLTGDEFHGGEAKQQLVRNASNTVAYFRDFLGKKFADIDPTNAHHSAHAIDVDGVPHFKIVQSANGQPSTVSVSEITTRHLRRLKNSASDFLGKPVTAAIITVPTDFTDSQREALTSAAAAADLQVLQIIQEPVAAALAYSAREDLQPHDSLLVVADFGGTRSDAAVVAIRGGMYTILATAHDYELGGRDLDQVLVDHFAKEFLKKHKSDPRENTRGLAKLKLESEIVKRTLSISTSASIGVDSLADGFDFHSTINRMRYELLAKKVFDQMVSLVETVVAKADLDLLDINEVILSGGSSHTPKIAQRIRAIFPETTVIHAPATETTALNPSELAAVGAAIQSSLVGEYDAEDIAQSLHPAVTVAPHLSKDIGVAIGDSFYPLLPAQTAIPARKVATFPAPAEGGDVVVKFAEGSREIVKTVLEKEPKPEKTEDDDEEDDSDDDFSDDEPEEVKERKVKVERVFAEGLLKGLEKGQEVEVTVTVTAEGAVNVAVRASGTQNGIRGSVEAVKA